MAFSISEEELERARESAVPAALREALQRAGVPGYLVGGAVRDTLLGVALTDPDVDVAVDGELEPVLERLAVPSRNHDRFATATVLLEGRPVDLARTRRETYATPGALPDVAPAPIRTDLARRDFTINAMAIPISDSATLIDPYGGRPDLRDRILRTIHPGSFVDDPTRALRGARYAARLDLEADPATREQLAAVDLGTVSADRVSAELLRIGGERWAVRAFALLDEWGVLELGGERLELIGNAAALIEAEPWSRLVDQADVLEAIATAEGSLLRAARELAGQDPGAPASELFERAGGHNDVELAIARALGAEWIDRHVTEWRRTELSIDGRTLAEAGIAEGPEVGRGLRAALHARLEGRIGPSAEEELAIAIAAAKTGKDL